MNTLAITGDTVELSCSIFSTGGAVTINNGNAVFVTHELESSIAFIEPGVGVQIATKANFPVNAWTPQLIGVSPDITHVAIILNAGSGSVYVTPVLVETI